jgi:hypothetical protein
MAHTYLNQGGTRWASDSKILVTGFFNGKRYYKMRKPMYWEQFGNFARCYVRVGDSVFRGATEDNNGVIELKLEKCYRVR